MFQSGVTMHVTNWCEGTLSEKTGSITPSYTHGTLHIFTYPPSWNWLHSI